MPSSGWQRDVGMVVARKPARLTPPWELRIVLLDVKPAVWRSVLIPSDITLAKLHAVIQWSMGWTNSHAHEFRINGTRYGQPDPHWDEPRTVDERRVALDKVLGHWMTRCFDYVYDFGDDWHHIVYVDNPYVPLEGSLAAPVCTAGENACPPEDVGGSPGYAEFLRARQDPTAPEHEDWAQWYDGDFNPARFDLAAINKRLKQIKL